MISHLMNNATFSTAVNQANNKNIAQVNARSEVVDNKQNIREATTLDSKTDSRVDTIKDSIKNGTYKLNLRGSAEKLAQELLR